MLIGGLQKTTLIDFPGKVACTVFTVGCNFRCPFCHNKDLVTLKNFKKSGLEEISEQSFFEFLQKRQKILDGVCISGGEPTLQPDLFSFCQKIKKTGFKIKLDTNGSHPQVIKRLIRKKLLDFIAMDIKTAFAEYQKAVYIKCQISDIKDSIKLILNSGLKYEFRTTLVPKIHNKKNILQMADDLKKTAAKVGIKADKIVYFLQSFRPQNCFNPSYLKLKPFLAKELEEILSAVKAVLPLTNLRAGSNY